MRASRVETTPQDRKPFPRRDEPTSRIAASRRPGDRSSPASNAADTGDRSRPPEASWLPLSFGLRLPRPPVPAQSTQPRVADSALRYGPVPLTFPPPPLATAESDIPHCPE